MTVGTLTNEAFSQFCKYLVDWEDLPFVLIFGHRETKQVQKKTKKKGVREKQFVEKLPEVLAFGSVFPTEVNG